MKKCPYCGRQNPDDAEKCGRCFAALEKAIAPKSNNSKPSWDDSDTSLKDERKE